MSFGITFSINFPDRLNLVICNTYNAKTSFLPFQASHFSIKNRSTNHVFLKTLLGRPFSHFFKCFSKNFDFGTPFEIRWAPKSAPGPRKDPAERVRIVFASRCFPILQCTLPHITFLYVISLGKCICRSPCDSRRAKRGVLGAADFQNGSQNRPPFAFEMALFSAFAKILKKLQNHCFYNCF